MSSPLATGDTLDTLNLHWWLPKGVCCNELEHGVDTRKRLWKGAIWDLLCCVRGEFLPYDWDGQDIAATEGHQRRGKIGRIMGELVLACNQLVADTEYHCNALRLRHFRNKTSPCDWCGCDALKGSPKNYSDFREGSLWMLSMVTLEQWMNNVTPHPLFEAHVLIGITIFSICLDILHILNLGVDRYFLGSLVWTMVHDSGLPGDFHTRAEYVWGRYDAAQKECGVPSECRLSREEYLTAFGSQTGAQPTQFPELDAKAAKIGHCLRPMLKTLEALQLQQKLTRDEDQNPKP